MNWKILKQKFPNSEKMIRGHFLETGITDGRSLIEDFLSSEGFVVNLGFIRQLHAFEKSLNKNDDN